MKTAASLLLVLLVAGCATLDSASQPTVPVPMSAVPPGKPGQYPGPGGEVLWADIGQAQTPRRARFDAWLVDGPDVKIARRPDGMWTGTFVGRPVTLSTSLGQIVGSGIDLAIERHGAGTWVTGIKDGRPREVYLYQMADGQETWRTQGLQVVGWQTGFNPVLAMELIAEGAWRTEGIVIPEQMDPDPYFALMDDRGIHHAMMEIEPGKATA